MAEVLLTSITMEVLTRSTGVQEVDVLHVEPEGSR